MTAPWEYAGHLGESERAPFHVQGEQHQELIVTGVNRPQLTYVNYRINIDKYSALRVEMGVPMELIRKASRKR